MQSKEHQTEPLRTRFVTEADLDACVAMEPTHFGCLDASQQETYSRFLGRLLHQGRALAVVVVNADNHPLAFGLSLFISNHFRHFLLSNSSKGLVGQVLHHFHSDQSVLTPRTIEHAHRREGLNLLSFYGWRRDLPPATLAEARCHLYLSFIYLHQGYHLQAFFKEVYGAQERDFYLKCGLRLYRQPEEYPAEYRKAEPYLMGIERPEAVFPLRVSDLFRVVAPPSLGRANHHRPSLLLFAQLAYLLRLPNTELARCLNITESTVANYWYRLGQRLSAHLDLSERRLGREECLMLFERTPEVIYPLRLHSLFFRNPELAHRYPLPLRTSPDSAAVVPMNVESLPIRSD